MSDRTLKEVRKDSPCPHCGHNSWCYILEVGKDGLLSVCKRDAAPANEWYKTSKTDSEGNFYYALNQIKKPIPKKGETYYYYPDRNGEQLIRVKRIDDGFGEKDVKQQSFISGKWVNNRKTIKSEDIPIYRYKEIRKAIDNGEVIFIAEGEKCADALWSIGLAATTNIGGTKKWLSSHAKDLSGAGKIVLVPDRDVVGLEHMELIFKDFPNAQWLYVGSDFFWQHLPQDHGTDIADYVIIENIKQLDVLGLITDHRVIEINKKKEVINKQSSDDLYDQIKQIYLSNLSESRKVAEGKKLGFNKKELTEYFNLFDDELINKSEKKELMSNFSDMSDVRKQDIDLHRYLYGDNGKLAKALKTVCKGALVPEINAFISLLSGAAPFIGKKSKVIISNKTRFVQPCVFWTAIIGESGSNKSFAQDLILSVLQDMENEAYKEYKNQKAEYDKLVKSNEQNLPEPPVRIRFIVKDATVAVLEKILSTCGGSLTYWRDELSGLVATRNRSGNGGDVQYELQEWNGSGIVTDRLDEQRQICIPKVAVSRTGTIQFDVLKDIAGDFRDTNGWFARWLFSVVESGKGLLNIVDDDTDEDTGVNDLLRQLFTKMQSLPNFDYLLSMGAKQSFQDWVNYLTVEQDKQSLEGLKLAYAKIKSYTARLALWLHCVNAVLADEKPSASISKETMDLAIELSAFFLRQVKFIHNVNSPSSGLLGDTLRVYEYIKGKLDGVTASNIKANRFNGKRKDIRTEHIKSMCQDLINGGYISEIDGRYFDKSHQKIDEVINSVKQPDSNSLSDLEDQGIDEIDEKLMTSSIPSNIDELRIVELENEKIDKLIQDGVHSLDSHSPTEEDSDRVSIDEGDFVFYEYEVQKVESKRGNMCMLFDRNGVLQTVSENELHKLTDEDLEIFRQLNFKVGDRAIDMSDDREIIITGIVKRMSVKNIIFKYKYVYPEIKMKPELIDAMYVKSLEFWGNSDD